MGAAATAVLLYTHGNITMLVVMYSINVFLTFSLTELGMSRHWIKDAGKEPRWKSQLCHPRHGPGHVPVHPLRDALREVRGRRLDDRAHHQRRHRPVLPRAAALPEVRREMRRLDSLLDIPCRQDRPPLPPLGQKSADRGGHGGRVLRLRPAPDPLHPEAVPLLLQEFRLYFGRGGGLRHFKGSAEIKRLEERTAEELQRYVDWCQAHGFQAAYRFAMDTEAVPALEELCREVAREFPRAIFFTGKLIFKEEKFIQRLPAQRDRAWPSSGACSSPACRPWCCPSGPPEDSIARRFEPVAHPGLGLDMARPDRVALDLVTELMDADAHGFRARVARFVPNLLDELFVAHDAPRVSDQDRQEVILEGGKMHFLLADPHAAGGEIHFQALRAHRPAAGPRGLRSAWRKATRMRAKSSATPKGLVR